MHYEISSQVVGVQGNVLKVLMHTQSRCFVYEANCFFDVDVVLVLAVA